ncbi:MAG: hypothetical protein WBX15_03575 [Thermoanaerobaculia bacterium]
MFPWLVVGLVLVAAYAGKVLRDAIQDDRKRAKVPKRRSSY